jgi:hypothetical protein
MVSSHLMIVLLVIIGCATTLAVIVIAVLEARRMDQGRGSVLSRKSPPENQ